MSGERGFGECFFVNMYHIKDSPDRIDQLTKRAPERPTLLLRGLRGRLKINKYHVRFN